MANQMRLEPTKYPTDILQTLTPILTYCVLPVVNKALKALDKDALVAFDHILTQKLYDIDKADVHRFIGGSNDGFLYARAFVVGMGKSFYEMMYHKKYRHIKKEMSRLLVHCEQLLYLATTCYEKRFGEKLPDSNLSYETGANTQ